MRKSFKATMSPSMIRSRNKKRYKGKLPTQPIFDPFIGKKVYINKNGRYVVVK